jgi:hypothetical protein
MAALHSAMIKHDNGDYRGSLADIGKLGPLATQIGLELPAVLHNYYNSIAVLLAANDKPNEASGFSGVLLTSPFRGEYPEWQ